MEAFYFSNKDLTPDYELADYFLINQKTINQRMRVYAVKILPIKK